MGVLKKAREADVPTLSSLGVAIPAQLERVVMGALSREPEGRPRNAGILQQELEGLLKAETPATARELGSFLRRLFDVPDEDTQEHRVEAEPSVEPPRGEGVPSLLAPLSVEQLLARFDHE